MPFYTVCFFLLSLNHRHELQKPSLPQFLLKCSHQMQCFLQHHLAFDELIHFSMSNNSQWSSEWNKIQSFLNKCKVSSTWHNHLGKESQVELSRLGWSMDMPMRDFNWFDWREKTNLEWGWQFFLGEWTEWAGERELSTACPLRSLFLIMELMLPIGSPGLLFLGLSTCGRLEPGTARPEKHFLP